MRVWCVLILAVTSVCLEGASSESCAGTMNKKVAIVTGATGQIGREIAIGVARSGLFSPILLTCRDEGRGKKLVDEISRESHGVRRSSHDYYIQRSQDVGILELANY